MNITLIGMPGAGKSTVGVVLSKLLHQLIEEHGTDGFLKLESEAVTEYKFENSVIATGGSVVYMEETMQYLKSLGKIVYINVPLRHLKKRVQSLEKRGVVARNATNLTEIYKERSALYEKYADFTVCTKGLTVEQSALKIASLFEIV